ncbi:MAG: ATP-dependent DNA helicase RecG [Clostridiales bacterium]|jgi:ATP-dependent DNA helicase RecG|nr:ATP-dependent DNA helicase RecG [Clostridiales bacterium]
MTRLFSNINTLKGVGEKRSRLYERLGITTPYELLYHFPRSYTDYTQVTAVIDAPINEYCVLKGTIVRKLPEQRIRMGLNIFKAIANDGTNNFLVVFFNNYYAFDALNVGYEYYFYGKVTGDLLKKEITSPHVIAGDSKELFQPVYSLTEGLTGAIVQTNIKSCLQILDSEPIEILPKDIIEENNLCGLTEAIKNIHFPQSKEMLDMAKKRLAFDELLTLQLGMLMLKGRNKQKTAIKMSSDTNVEILYQTIPFELTNAQKQAISEICADLCSSVPMNRLLQGDVGSGKTAVAAAACYFAYLNGCQSALMAPTEILAIQHYNTLCEFLGPLGVQVCLLTGSLTAKKKNAVKEQIQNGEISVVVGTHAIIQKSTVFKKLGLVITDEQHRFGVEQRAALAEKGGSPHKLVMSATPIPRTLALIIYGDLDISILNELPKGRAKIETFAVTGKLRERAYNFIRDRLNENKQAYIVCPMIDENDNDLIAVTTYAQKLQEGAFSGYNVGLLHGRMSSADKERVMNDFRNGDIDLLISTTVVEVGVDVPNAVVMMIENSDRFGLSQLHQLRGRVGRGMAQSYCILVTDNINDDVKHRLRIMSSTTDGFKISEEDLKLRGPGDFFGKKQHGLPQLKIADIAGDMELMKTTQMVARRIIDEDSELKLPKNGGLRVEVIRLFAKSGDNSLN